MRVVSAPLARCVIGAVCALAAGCEPSTDELTRQTLQVAKAGEKEAYEAAARNETALPNEAYYGQRESLTRTFTWHLEGTGEICIVTHHTSALDVFAELSTRNHAEYARVHDYPYSRLRGRFSGDDFVNFESDKPATRYGLSWQKLTAVRHVLDRRAPSGEPACRWVMWVDSDILFTNFAKRLEDIVFPAESAERNPVGLDKHVILSREEVRAVRAPINAGAFFVRNSAVGRAFIDEVAAMFPTYRHGNSWEQDAIRDWALQLPYQKRDITQTWDELKGRLRPEVFAHRQRVFNSFYGPHLDPGSDGYWRDGDFIAHFVGGGDNARRERMGALLGRMARGTDQEAPTEVGPNAGQD